MLYFGISERLYEVDPVEWKADVFLQSKCTIFLTDVDEDFRVNEFVVVIRALDGYHEKDGCFWVEIFVVLLDRLAYQTIFVEDQRQSFNFLQNHNFKLNNPILHDPKIHL